MKVPLHGVIPAAGIGSRMGEDTPKQYRTVHGMTLLEYSVQALLQTPGMQSVTIALHPDDAIGHDLHELGAFDLPRSQAHQMRRALLAVDQLEALHAFSFYNCSTTVRADDLALDVLIAFHGFFEAENIEDIGFDPLYFVGESVEHRHIARRPAGGAHGMACFDQLPEQVSA